MTLFSYFAWGVFFSLTLLISPVGYVGLMIARRRYQLSYLLLLPVIAAVALQAALITGPDGYEFSSFVGRLGIAVFFSPVIVGLMLVAWWGLSRRWYRILVWLSALVLLTIVFAAIGLISSIRSMPLAAEESFDWQGWYLIAFPAAYFLAWFMMFATLAEWLVGLAARRFQASKLVRWLPRFSHLNRDVSGVATVVHPAQELKRS
jgi:hypothetical protein